MPNMKKAALRYAEEGTPVFPCEEGGKRPLIKDFKNKSSTNPERIAKWWERWPDANIGTVPGNSDCLVIDVDPGGDIKPFPATKKRARTPRGGVHLWYTVPSDEHIPNSAGHLNEKGELQGLAEHIDVRGHDGYVVIPPSHTDKGVYEWERTGLPRAAPKTLIEDAKEKASNSRDIDPHVWLIEPDQPKHVKLARDAAAGNGTYGLYKAVEGKSGDQATFEAACMMHSFGLSEGMALEVMWDVYNPRCNPPWDYDDMEKKVRNAYTYPQHEPGNVTEEYKRVKRRQQTIELLDQANKGEGRQAKGELYRAIDREAMELIKPPEWIIDTMIPEEAYGMLYGIPGSYKTFVALDMALSIAAKKKHWMKTLEIKKHGPVIYVAGEGRASLLKRVRAWEEQFNGGKQVKDFILADPVPRVTDGFEAFMDVVGKLEDSYVLTVLDTVSRSLAGEDENTQKVASAFTLEVERLKREFETTVLAIHHSGRQKDQNIVPTERGSSVFFADTDVMIACHNSRLHMLKQKDAEEWSNPLAFEVIQAHNSLIVQPRAVKDKPTDDDKEPTRQERAALKLDSHIAKVLSKAPIGVTYSQPKMASFLATTSRKINSVNSAAAYLVILKCFNDSATAKFFDSERSEWRNYKANR